MILEGDGPEGQPTEGVTTLDGLASEMDAGEDALDDDLEDEAGEESEEVEAAEEDEEEGEDEEREEGEGEDPTVKLKHDGKEIEVKLSEALNLAQQGYDYTKKTMVVAEEREAARAERTKAAEARQQYEQIATDSQQRLQGYIQYMEQQVGHPPSAELLSQDTQAYLIQKEQYEARKGQLQQAYAAQRQLQDEQARHRQAWIAERAEAAEKALKDTLPGWDNSMLDTLSGYVSQLGLTPQSASEALLEPGFWQLAHKAKAYDALVAEKAKLKPKATLPKVQKPSAANHPNRSDVKRADAEKRYRSNPSLDTLSSFIE
jgi:hypothetical protein